MASACCARIRTASEKPRSSITSASTMYITPIFLWSTLLSHSFQMYGRWPLMTTQASTPVMTIATTAEEISGSG